MAANTTLTNQEKHQQKSTPKWFELTVTSRLQGMTCIVSGVLDFANKGAEGMIIDFFRRLFARHGIAWQ